MVLGLLLREDEERTLAFDFEPMLPKDEGMDDDNGHGGRKDFKRGTVVCRHWLRALCMKGDSCEFLHQFDMSRMPECRWGMECQVPECPFRHVPDEERVECAFYKQGFCSHGSSCRYRHIKLAREECPDMADFSLQAKVADEENVKRRKAQPVNEFFKIAICKHWEKQGSCPFNDECHFAHGEKELRPFPKGGENDPRSGRSSGPGNGPGSGRESQHHQSHGRANFAMAERPQQAPPLAPLLPDANKRCKYFLVHSQSYRNLAHGVHFHQWALPSATAQALKLAAETSDDVFLVVTVSPSRHFQGLARLVPGAMLQVAGAAKTTADAADSVDNDNAGEDLAAASVPYTSDGKATWSGAFGVEWLRICECPWERLQQFENKQLAVADCPNGLELDTDVGHALVRLLFNQAQIQLHYKSVEDEQRLPGGAAELAARRRDAAESLFGGPGPLPLPGFGAGGPVPTPRYPVSLPGFVFACNNATIDECFGRMVFGLAKDQEANAATHVVPGAPLFLLNMSDRHVLGIFEAASPVTANLIPGAFTSSTGGTGPTTALSPFPVQVRFTVALNAPAISSAEPQIQRIVGDRGVRMGPLSLEVTQQLADAFAERCGAGAGPPGPRGMGPPPSIGGVASGPMGASAALSKDPSGSGFLEKMVVGIENDTEFSVTRRIIGHAGANMKRISADAGGNAKVRVRGRGSGSKEGGVEELHEPLVVLVSADTERSFRVARDLTSELLAGIHHDYRHFLAQKAQRGQGGGHFPAHTGGFPPAFHHGPPPGGPSGSGFPPLMRGGGGGPVSGPFVKQEPLL